MTQNVINDDNGKKKNDFILFYWWLKLPRVFQHYFQQYRPLVHIILLSIVFNLIFSFDIIIPLKSTIQV